MHIVEGGLDDPRVVELLRTHLTRARAETAPGSAHALDLSGLRAPGVTFWSVWEGDAVVGIGALKRLSADHGEVKSMHTAGAARGRGVGSAMLGQIMATARAGGMSRLSLETGSWPYFAPARALYARHGFVECPPFGDYRPDPNSVFMTLALSFRRDLDAATGYQELLVPALMQEWAPRVAEAAGIGPGDRVLDVACGTGVLTREAARRAGRTGAVTGLDLSPEMLAVAARLSPALRWQQGSADALPFADQSFDAVVSQFGLMFFPDPVAGLREMMRVLVPGGRLAVAVWGSLADTPAYAAEVALVERLAGREAGDALRAPFVLGDPKRMAELCAAAGIKGARIAMQPGRGHFPSIRTMVEVDVRDWLHIVGVTLDEGLIETILRESETVLRPFLTIEGDGVGFDSPAVLATATR